MKHIVSLISEENFRLVFFFRTLSFFLVIKAFDLILISDIYVNFPKAFFTLLSIFDSPRIHELNLLNNLFK